MGGNGDCEGGCEGEGRGGEGVEAWEKTCGVRKEVDDARIRTWAPERT